MTGSAILLALAICIVLALAVFVPVVLRARKVDLAANAEAPRTPPPGETLDALKEDGEEGLFDLSDGEKIAAPFAEQIEDILAARVKTDPGLASVKVDFATAPDGSLQIWVDEVCYTDIAKIPNEKLRQALMDAIQAWEKHYEKS